MKECALGGADPVGQPCKHFKGGHCHSPNWCRFQDETVVLTTAEDTEHVEIPARIQDLLARIAGGNFQLDSRFLDSDTLKTFQFAAELTDYHSPTSDRYQPGRFDEPNTVEQDGIHLAALNTTLGQVLGDVQSQVEDVKAYIKELEARKEIQVEASLRSGHRLGGISDRRVKAVVKQDPQVVEAEAMLSMARRRAMILRIMCERVESTVNMLKIRARGLRREQ
jgi:hypothetical protein